MFDIVASGLESGWLRKGVATVALGLAVLLLRWFLAVHVRRTVDSSDLQRRWLVQVRNGCFLLLVVGLVTVWSAELRDLALSLVAILVAIVLATKELILCFSGSLLKARADAFAVGDRIEVGALRGDVVDQTLLTTKLAEVAPGSNHYTGRSLTLPNSLFLTTPVANQSAIGGYVLHSFTVPVAAGEADRWRIAEARLLEAARHLCADYVEPARAQLEAHSRRHGLAPVDAEPRITILMPDLNRIDLNLRVPAPARQGRRLEQEILRRYLATLATTQTKESP